MPRSAFGGTSELRILYISHTLPPEPGPTLRPLAQAKELEALGHSVLILTTMPHAPLGRIFDGYRHRMFLRESMEGVEILRIWSLPSPNHGVFRRTLSHFSFGMTALLVGLLLSKRDLIISSVPNVGTELGGYVLARLRRSRFLLEMRDLIPDNLALVGTKPTSSTYRLLDAYFSFFYRHADWLALPGRSMIEALVRRGITRDRLLYLPHAVDAWTLRPPQTPLRDQLGIGDDFVVLYCGSFSPYYDIPTMIDAAQLLVHMDKRVRILLLGTGRDRSDIETSLRTRGISNVTLCDPVPPHKVPQYLQLAQLGLAPFVACWETPIFRDHLTTKATQYLGWGVPVVSIERAHSGVSGRLLERIGVGARVEAADARGLAETIVAYSRDPQRCARESQRAEEYARSHLSRRVVVSRFERELTRRMYEDARHTSKDRHGVGIHEDSLVATAGVQQPEAQVIRSPTKWRAKRKHPAGCGVREVQQWHGEQ